MEPPEGQTGAQQLNNNLPPPPPIPPTVVDTPPDEPGDRNQTHITQTPPQEPVRIIIEKDNRIDRYALIANIISLFALFFAAGAFFYGYESYNETKRQFKIANEPYLQTSIRNITYRDSTMQINFTIDFKNIGNYPVAVTDYWVAASYGNQWVKFNEAKTNGMLIAWGGKTGNYITKDSSFVKPISIRTDESTYGSLKDIRSEKFLTIIGEMNYENLVDTTKKMCRFEITIQPFVPNYNELILNKNTP